MIVQRAGELQPAIGTAGNAAHKLDADARQRIEVERGPLG